MKFNYGGAFRLKVGPVYYGKFESGIEVLFRVTNFNFEVQTLASTANWEDVPSMYDLLSAKEIPLNDLPLYLSWPLKFPIFLNMLKENHEYHTKVA
jgi:hypothetical protein